MILWTMTFQCLLFVHRCPSRRQAGSQSLSPVPVYSVVLLGAEIYEFATVEHYRLAVAVVGHAGDCRDDQSFVLAELVKVGVC